LIALVAGFGLIVHTAHAANFLPTITYTVNTQADDAGATGCPSPGVCSFRDAVDASNGAASTDVVNIMVPAGHYKLTNGELYLNSAGIVQISGAGSAVTTVDGSGNASGTRVFQLEGAAVTMSGFTITGGTAPTGGAIWDHGTQLALNNNVITGNNAGTTGVGGALDVAAGAGPVTLTSDIFSNNSAEDGGALYITPGTYNVVSGTGDTFTGNVACTGFYNNALPPAAGNPCLGSGDGGAIYDDGVASLSIANSSFTGNQAGSPSDQPNQQGNGGAVYLDGGYAAYFTNDTFNRNLAGADGGALDNEDDTVSVVGGGMGYNVAGQSGGAVYQDNTGFFSTGVNYTYNQAGGMFVCQNPDIHNHVFCTSSSGPTAPDTCPASYYQCNYDSGEGGGIYFNEPGSMSGGQIYQNYAVSILSAPMTVDPGYGGQGGGLDVNDHVAFTDVRIFQNKAYDGGGIYLTSTYPETMHAGQMFGNYALDDGGAYYVSSGAYLIVDGTFINGNTAANQTGGVWDQANGGLALTAGTHIIANTSPGLCKNVLNPCT
jgi:hypothetical protein